MDERAQTLEEAQDTNRRMNRRLGAVEAPLHSLVSRAFDQVSESQRMAQSALSTAAAHQRTIQWQSDQISTAKERLSTTRRALTYCILWATVATAALVWLIAR